MAVILGCYAVGKRVVDIGLRLSGIDEAVLEELLVGFEERIRRGIEERVGRRLDEMEIIVEADYGGGGELTVKVDVRVTGRLIAPLSYDEVVAEAIEEAAEWLERQLRARVAEGEGAKDTRACR